MTETTNTPEGFNPEDSLEYITRRLMQIEVALYRGPAVMRAAREAATVAEEKLNRAKARALLAAPVQDEAGRKLTAAEREAHAFLAVNTEREEWQTKDAAHRYAQDVNRALDREKDALQTRSANLRAEAQLAGAGAR
ncbi:hypothetical protein GS966_11115 [Rhodococcus hoagii]|nr:hypothetical protein [Prescottella equi]